ncbi:hypothetical protein LSAT2_029679 [Lamellibrachia satsuma]|nr:hypothetical protein LSAT2_029679 [Lamellibrachia satsuma]
MFQSNIGDNRGEESQPEEESPDVGTSGCTCSCAIHQSPPKHTMPRAVQTRQSMRSKGCTAKLKTRILPTVPPGPSRVDPPPGTQPDAETAGVLTSTPKKKQGMMLFPL